MGRVGQRTGRMALGAMGLGLVALLALPATAESIVCGQLSDCPTPNAAIGEYSWYCGTPDYICHVICTDGSECTWANCCPVNPATTRRRASTTTTAAAPASPSPSPSPAPAPASSSYAAPPASVSAIASAVVVPATSAASAVPAATSAASAPVSAANSPAASPSAAAAASGSPTADQTRGDSNANANTTTTSNSGGGGDSGVGAIIGCLIGVFVVGGILYGVFYYRWRKHVREQRDKEAGAEGLIGTGPLPPHASAAPSNRTSPDPTAPRSRAASAHNLDAASESVARPPSSRVAETQNATNRAQSATPPGQAAAQMTAAAAAAAAGIAAMRGDMASPGGIASPGVPGETPHWAYSELVGIERENNNSTAFPEDAEPAYVLHDFIPPPEPETFSDDGQIDDTTESIELRAGDRVKIKRAFRDGWGYGVNLRTDEMGMFPLEYLRVGPDPHPAPIPGSPHPDRFESRFQSPLSSPRLEPMSGRMYGAPSPIGIGSGEVHAIGAEAARKLLDWQISPLPSWQDGDQQAPRISLS